MFQLNVLVKQGQLNVLPVDRGALDESERIVYNAV